MQDLIAISIGLMAAAFLVYRGWQTVMKRKAGCGACSNCPASSTTTHSELVTISPIMPHAQSQSRKDI
jgi:hypothetical protein